LVTKGTGKQLTKMRNNGFALMLTSIVIFVLTILGLGLLTTSYGVRLRAIKLRKETTAKLTAEAGYEDAIRWMNEQADVLGAMAGVGRPGRGGGSSEIRTRKITGSSSPIEFPNSSFKYSISFDRFLGSQPVYEIVSNGYCDRFSRTIKALVVQAVSGWDMGSCRIPTDNLTSEEALFTGEDIIDIPIHVNSADPQDNSADIYVSMRNRPRFRQQVSVEESRYMWWGRKKDKYGSLINLFDKGIYFDQPPNKVLSYFIAGVNDSVVQKVRRFRLTTKPAFRFAGAKRPIASKAVPLSWSAAPAVQLEFYVDGSSGMVKITNNCTVRRVGGFGNDLMLAAWGGNLYTQYPIYAFHYADPTTTRSFPIGATYVSQRASTPSGRVAITPLGGQIFIEGNAIIGGAVDIDSNGNVFVAGTTNPSKVGGRLTVVAEGNIWIVSPIIYDGAQSSGFGGGQVPTASNENMLGLFSQSGVVKVVDPGLSLNVPTSGPGVTAVYGPGGALKYRPIGYQNPSSSFIANRLLPQSMVVQASITVCGGGWGAENVGARTNTNLAGKDTLIVAGSITEAVQGIVAVGTNGFRRCYYFDGRLLTGILPGDMWLQSKYIPTPGGWSDFRP
jgi:hypothetical protein